MKDKWLLIKEKVNALTLRERSILFATLLVVVVFVWLQLVFLPWESKQKSLNGSISQAQQDIASSSEQLAVLAEQLQKNPNDPLREEGLRLNSELDKLGAQIEQKLAHLMAPQQMAAAMQEVLSHYSGMTLVSAKNLPVQALELGDRGAAESSDEDVEPAEDSQAVVFSHGFEMKLEGRFFQALELIQRLEKMKGFYWHTIDYQVERYPNAVITIQLTTLSLEEEWIGV